MGVGAHIPWVWKGYMATSDIASYSKIDTRHWHLNSGTEHVLHCFSEVRQWTVYLEHGHWILHLPPTSRTLNH